MTRVLRVFGIPCTVQFGGCEVEGPMDFTLIGDRLSLSQRVAATTITVPRVRVDDADRMRLKAVGEYTSTWSVS